MDINQPIWKWVLLLALLFFGAASLQGANQAVFIGLNSYDNMSYLEKPVHDAGDLRAVSMAAGIVASNNTETLTYYAARQKILDAIRRRALAAGPGDLLLISYSGHGEKGGLIHASDALISSKDLADAMAGSACDRVVFINDSCYSEAFPLPVKGKSSAMVYGAASNKTATYSVDYRPGAKHLNGVASKYVVMALEHGRGDLDGDGRITAHELGLFVQNGIAGCEEVGLLKQWEKSVQRYGPSGLRAAWPWQRENYGVSAQGGGAKGDDIVIAVRQAGQRWEPAIIMPYLVGRSRGEAATRLKTLGRDPVFKDYQHKPGRAVSARYRNQVGAQEPDRGQPLALAPRPVLYMLPDSVAAVPPIVGLSLEEAKKTVEKAGLLAFPRGKPAGPTAVVGGQRPSPGEQVLTGSYVQLLFLPGGDVVVPRVRGETVADAKRILEAGGLVCAVSTNSPFNTGRRFSRSSLYPPFRWGGLVWRCWPREGASVSPGSTVTVMVPPEPVRLPKIVGQSEAKARRLLQNAGLVMEICTNVCSQTTDNPKGVELHRHLDPCYKGDVVEVVIEYPEVPRLMGLTEQQARQACTQAKLRLSVTRDPVLTGPADQVVRQAPAAGQRAHQQDVVTVSFPASGKSTNLVLQVDGKPVTENQLWGVFPTTQELGTVNEQLRSDSVGDDGQGHPVLSRRWSAGSQSRSVSVTITVLPDRAAARSAVADYGKNGAGLQAMTFGDAGYWTGDPVRPYYQFCRRNLLVTYFTRYARGGVVGPQDDTLKRIIQRIDQL